MFLGVFNMVAFERIKSGIPQLDETLDNIRLGDNVVWQVSNLDEFLYFVKPFVKLIKRPTHEFRFNCKMIA